MLLVIRGLYLLVAYMLLSMSVVFVLFFFFKQNTAYGLRISDWSSDVCSSDLRVQHPMAIDISRLRPGRGFGALEMRLHCEPQAGERRWRWFGHASALAARFTGGVGSLRDDFPDALLRAVSDDAFDPHSRALAAHLNAQTLLLAGRAADASTAFEHAALAWDGIADAERASAARVGAGEDLNRSGQYARVLSLARAAPDAQDGGQIGRASCRARVGPYVSISVGELSLKKTMTN